MTNDELRKLEQARPAARREPQWGDLTDLARDPAPEPASPDTDFYTSAPGDWFAAVTARPARARPGSPQERIEMIEGSLRCLRRAVWGLLPLVGLPFTLLALAEYGRVKTPADGWNPARKQLIAGGILAMLGCACPLWVMSYVMFQAWDGGGLALFLVSAVSLMFCLPGVRRFCVKCAESFSRHPFWHLLWMTALPVMALEIITRRYAKNGLHAGTEHLIMFCAGPLLAYALIAGVTTRLEASFRRHYPIHLSLLITVELIVAASISRFAPELPGYFYLTLAIIAPLAAHGFGEYHTPSFREAVQARIWFYLLWPALVLPVLWMVVALIGMMHLGDPHQEKMGLLVMTEMLGMVCAVPLLVYAVVAGLTSRFEESFCRDYPFHLFFLVTAELILAVCVSKIAADIPVAGDMVGYFFLSLAIIAPLAARGLGAFHPSGFRNTVLARVWFYLLWPAFILPVILFASQFAD